MTWMNAWINDKTSKDHGIFLSLGSFKAMKTLNSNVQKHHQWCRLHTGIEALSNSLQWEEKGAEKSQSNTG